MRVIVTCAVLVLWSWSVGAAAQALPPPIVSGTVVDEVGAAVADAAVTMTIRDGATLRNATTDARGAFSFSDVALGSYVVRVEVAGFTPFSSGAVTVSADTRALILPRIVLTVGTFSTSITVRSTEAVAEEQIKNQERQRLLGAFPNFYVSYVPDAAPLTSRQKFSLAAHETFDWTAFAGASVAAAIDQSTSAHPGFGDGASGYAKRWAAIFADNRTGDVLTHYAFASLFHQDPRYFVDGPDKTFGRRAAYAASRVFVTRSESGRAQFNYSRIAGEAGAVGLSTLYNPSADRSVSGQLTSLGVRLMVNAASNELREFWPDIRRHLIKH